MLSIGKVGLARDQQLYYEQKVARGADDYYAGRGEAPGRWAGGGADLLDLAGEVDADQLKLMMDGRHPVTGLQLAVRRPRSTTAAIDLTFSAPKSVSVLFAIADTQVSRALVEAHEESVDAALSYLEREACRVRRGHNGTRAEREAADPRGLQRARSERAGGFVAAAYRHRMSRAQDPQLHTHVVCANMAQGRDGRWTALDGTAIYAHAKAAGFLYEAHLRRAVRERLPWAEWGPVRSGIAELVHVSERVRTEFSQRRRRILERQAELEAAGVVVGHAGRERIAYDTREAKREVTDADWREQVRARAAEHGLGREELARLSRLPDSAAGEEVSNAELARRLLSPAGLTATQNTFRARDVAIALAEAHNDGARTDEVLAQAQRLLRDPEVVPVGFGLDRRYTTRELLRAEELIVRHAEEGERRSGAVLPDDQLHGTLARLSCPLSGEQRQAVMAIARSGNRIDALEALAGTGKTTCAAALREVYEHAGFRVIGAAPTGRAVRELKERAAISESRTLDGWALKLAADPHALSFAHPIDGRARHRPAVLIIDEAGMAPTRVSAAVIDRALSADVKIIAIGDSGQLSSVQAGGWLAPLSRRVGAGELREVMRQRDPRERRALAKLNRGQPEQYLELKRDRGELRVFAGELPGLDAEQALIERWAAACARHGEQQAVMICRDNARRARLNELARAHLRERGKLGESVEVGDRGWAVGERVIARRNDRGRDLDNGMRGTITAADQDKFLLVRLDAGGLRHLDADYVREHVQHAYALTGHGMQGATVEWAGIIGQSRDFSRNWSYTALSRAREPVDVFVVDEQTDSAEEREEIAPRDRAALEHEPLEWMRARMRERDDEDLALDQLEQAELPTGESISPLRERIYERDEQLEIIHTRLNDSAIEDAKTISDLENTIAAVEQARRRERKPWRRRERIAYNTRAREREQHLACLREREEELLERVRDPEAVLEDAAELRERQGELIMENLRLYDQAIKEELARRPRWLEETLGPEPHDHDLRERWQKTAHEIAARRIREHITDPRLALSEHARDHPLQRAISDTRAALGVDRRGPGHDLGFDY